MERSNSSQFQNLASWLDQYIIFQKNKMRFKRQSQPIQ